MNYDYYSSLSEEHEAVIEKILKLEKEMKTEKTTTKKQEKAKEANKERIKLLSPNPHLSYHSLVVKSKAAGDNFRSTWQDKNLQIDLSKRIKEHILDDFLKEFIHPSIDVSLLPKCSFLLQFKFTLEKPYISRDEQDFYIIDNPIRKDKVFGLPYIASSSWKGSLRAALWQLDHKAEDEEIRRIFGNERRAEEDERLHAGRLRLFSTFFTNKGLEVINPHDREQRSGRKLIRTESVPINTCGQFTALYVPFDLIGNKEIEIKKQISRDILLITKGLKSMFRDYGFGAKTSSGFGAAKNELNDGKLILKAEGIKSSHKEEIKIQKPEEAFEKYLNEDGSVKDEFKGGGEDGFLSNTQYRKMKDQLGGGSLGEFKKFRQWYKNYGEQWEKYIQSESAPAPKWPTWTFKSFDELLSVAEEIGKSLKSREEIQ